MLQFLTRIVLAWHARQTAILRLRSLDDRLLADMGIAREDIVCAVTCD
jgi:uncharacterized protein YjiS (DUF1127 family)